jgi:hypothetical protein
MTGWNTNSRGLRYRLQKSIYVLVVSVILVVVALAKAQYGWAAGALILGVGTALVAHSQQRRLREP